MNKYRLETLGVQAQLNPSKVVAVTFSGTAVVHFVTQCRRLMHKRGV